jgi:hypothetical protein
MTNQSPSHEASIEGIDDQLNCQIRPRVNLLDGHDQKKPHILKVRAPDGFVPVPIGPGIPRRDKKDLRARYCRLMLIRMLM